MVGARSLSPRAPADVGGASIDFYAKEKVAILQQTLVSTEGGKASANLRPKGSGRFC
jgi:hypothetical protein